MTTREIADEILKTANSTLLFQPEIVSGKLTASQLSAFIAFDITDNIPKSEPDSKFKHYLLSKSDMIEVIRIIYPDKTIEETTSMVNDFFVKYNLSSTNSAYFSPHLKPYDAESDRKAES